MAAGVQELANTDEVVTAVDELEDGFEQQRQDFADLDETRQSLETAPEPVADGEGVADEVDEERQEQAVQKFVDGDIEDVEELEEEIEDAYTPAEQRPGYAMTDDRRVGAITMPVEGEGNVRFGKPSGRAGIEMLETLSEMEQSGRSLLDQIEWAWETLDEWALEAEYDADYWSNAIGGVDAIALLRNVAMGGNMQSP